MCDNLIQLIRNTRFAALRACIRAPGFDVNAPVEGHSLVYWTLRHTCKKCVQELVAIPALQLSASDLFDDAGEAITSGASEIVAREPRLQVDGLTPDQRGRLLVFGAKEGHRSLVEKLLALPGVDVAFRRPRRKTALEEAILKGHAEIVALLRAAAPGPAPGPAPDPAPGPAPGPAPAPAGPAPAPAGPAPAPAAAARAAAAAARAAALAAARGEVARRAMEAAAARAAAFENERARAAARRKAAKETIQADPCAHLFENPGFLGTILPSKESIKVLRTCLARPEVVARLNTPDGFPVILRAIYPSKVLYFDAFLDVPGLQLHPRHLDAALHQDNLRAVPPTAKEVQFRAALVKMIPKLVVPAGMRWHVSDNMTMYYAIKSNLPTAVQFLLTVPDINLYYIGRGFEGGQRAETIFEVATRLGRPEIVTILRDAGAGIPDRIAAAREAWRAALHAAIAADLAAQGDGRAAAEAQAAAQALRDRTKIEQLSKPVTGLLRTGDPKVEAAAFTEAKKDKDLFAGFSKADESVWKQVFSEEKLPGQHATIAANTSLCPFCLCSSERSAGCIYMRHTCRGIAVSKALFDTYVEGSHVFFCTVCGRPANKHGHHQVSHVFGPKSKIMPQNVTIGIYKDDCRPFGGGGYAEKVARFHALREEAMRLNTLIGKITHTEARLRLLKAYWNAPLEGTAVAKATELITAKGWANNNAFPARIAKGPPQAAAPPSPEAYNDVPYDDEGGALLPVIHAEGENAETLDDVAPAIEFRHKNQAGVVTNHGGQRLGVDTIFRRIADYVKNFGVATFGYCILSSEADRCTTIHPAELEHILLHAELPEADFDRYNAILVRYKELYNKKFAKNKKKGGARTRAVKAPRITKTRKAGPLPLHFVKGAPSLFPEAEDMTCAIVKPSSRTGSRSDSRAAKSSSVNKTRRSIHRH